MSDYQDIFPETITSDPRYQRNLDWGKSRPGHPEGTVRAHIAEVDRNLETLRAKVSDTDYWRLRVLIHTHDTFKGRGRSAVFTSPHPRATLRWPVLSSRSSATTGTCRRWFSITTSLSRCGDSLKPRGTFNQERHGGASHEHSRLERLSRFQHCGRLYRGGKTEQPLLWLFQQVAGKVQSRFTETRIPL